MIEVGCVNNEGACTQTHAAVVHELFRPYLLTYLSYE